MTPQQVLALLAILADQRIAIDQAHAEIAALREALAERQTAEHALSSPEGMVTRWSRTEYHVTASTAANPQRSGLHPTPSGNRPTLPR